jgi:hypothetical protein
VLEQKAKQQLGLEAEQDAPLQPRFVPDNDLDALTQPLERYAPLRHASCSELVGGLIAGHQLGLVHVTSCCQCQKLSPRHTFGT